MKKMFLRFWKWFEISSNHLHRAIDEAPIDETVRLNLHLAAVGIRLDEYADG